MKRRFFSCSANLLAKVKPGTSHNEPVLLGRPSNNLKGGIVGLANVGKSTFFQAITKSDLGNPANYPFATIDPEEARVIVPSYRFDQLCEIYKPNSKVPAHLTVFDIAGLVRGASSGEGLGNAFLSHIRAVDGLFQMVRAFPDAEVTHVEGSVDAVRDLEIIHTELLLKDHEFALAFLQEAQNAKKGGGGKKSAGKSSSNDITTISKVIEHLDKNNRVASGSWSLEEAEVINKMALLTAKPSVYLANISEDDYISVCEGQRNIGALQEIQEWISQYSPGDKLLPVSVNLEHRLSTDPTLQKEMLDLGVKSAVADAITALRDSLNLISFFTCGSDEVREWTIRRVSISPLSLINSNQRAQKLHRLPG